MYVKRAEFWGWSGYGWEGANGFGVLVREAGFFFLE